jgi:hypothetical protein
MHACMHVCVCARARVQIYLPDTNLPPTEQKKKRNLGDGEDDAKEGSQVEGR